MKERPTLSWDAKDDDMYTVRQRSSFVELQFIISR